ncbi:MAG: hypothetical protein J2P25_24770 [Nocardiopsaceae bacterium]|nr:hypothetical protein [Nocardiopsaceae bacterium]
MWATFATALVIAIGYGVISASGAAHGKAASRATTTGFGADGRSLGATGGSATAVRPAVTTYPDGSVRSVYRLPDGEVITSTTPPRGFDPLHASNAQLKRYGFPLRPGSDGSQSDLADWRAAMTAYRSDSPPSGPLKAVPGSGSRVGSAASFATEYSNWGGYIVGKTGTQSNTYVAVTNDFTVPSTSNTCMGSNLVGMWTGLGGTSSNPDNLVQQGIECGDSAVGSGSAFRPFTEFANTANPVALCGQTSWTFPAGHLLYEQMSYEASNKIANFYIEDETSGVAHGCSAAPPSGWSYDDNTAEWIGEAPSGTAVHFSNVNFTNAQAELDSNGSWVTFGSQGTITKTIAGASSSTYCISPGSIGSDKDSFTDSWHQATCY